jgi:heptosyltransferase I
MAEIRRILIVRLSALGDIVHTLPALALLRTRFPGAHIAWLVEPPGDALLRLVPGLDEIIPLGLRNPSWRARWQAVTRLVRSQRGRYDVVLDFQGLVKSALLSSLVGGRRIGFAGNTVRERPAAWFYTRRVAAPAPDQHVIRKNLALAASVAGAEATLHYPLLAPEPTPVLAAFLAGLAAAPRSLVAVNIGGGWPSKVPEEGWWIRFLAAAKGLPLVLLWGTEAERACAGRLSAASGVPLAPFLTFADLAALLRDCRLLVSADSLPLHLADAVATPSLGIFGPTSPARNGSVLPTSRALTAPQACQFCYKRKCDTILCLRQIDPEAAGVVLKDMHETLR